MERTFQADSNRLNDVLEHPDLEREFQEVFSFVASITGQKPNLTDLTSENITAWNKQFDAVLKKLFIAEGGMDNDKKKKTQESRNQEEIFKKAYVHSDTSKF